MSEVPKTVFEQTLNDDPKAIEEGLNQEFDKQMNYLYTIEARLKENPDNEFYKDMVALTKKRANDVVELAGRLFGPTEVTPDRDDSQNTGQKAMRVPESGIDDPSMKTGTTPESSAKGSIDPSVMATSSGTWLNGEQND